jgi:large subunit ribosomal protein L21
LNNKPYVIAPQRSYIDIGQFGVLEFTFLYGGEKIYAIIEISGKQYKVAPKQKIEVERLDVPEGDVVELDRVLLIGEDKNTLVGSPVIKGAKVVATSLGETKGEKVIVFRYKSKVRYRSKRGHRQTYTKILVNEIVKGKGK